MRETNLEVKQAVDKVKELLADDSVIGISVYSFHGGYGETINSNTEIHFNKKTNKCWRLRSLKASEMITFEQGIKLISKRKNTQHLQIMYPIG